MKIARLDAWEVLDSRGQPTVACEVELDDGARGVATVPSGASTGTHEAHELRDGDERYGGRGVRGAVAHVVRELQAAARGLDAADQRALDDALRRADGSADLGVLGANAVLSVSVASALAAASSAGVPLYRFLLGDAEPTLPLPMVNVVSGGAHAAGGVDVQDFLVIPLAAGSFAEAIERCARIRSATADIASERGLPAWLVADEGGIGCALETNRAALELLATGIERAGLRLGDEAAIAIDVAATQLGASGQYAFRREARTMRTAELLEELGEWAESFPILSLEDPLGEDDWDGWATLSRSPLRDLQLIGDDLFATNLERLERGITGGGANAVLVKPNQAGTLTQAFDVVRRAKEAGFATIVSARSGETEDTWLADLAVGWNAGQIKVGSTTRSERTAKWNRLLRIEHELAGQAVLANPLTHRGITEATTR